jgi:hypothetical protein
MSKRLVFLMLILLYFIVPVSCKRDHYKVNISSVRADLAVQRLEKDLFSPDPAEIQANVSFLKDKYDGFLQLFSYVINTGDVNDPSFSDFLIRFCTDRLNNEVFGKVMEKYPDMRNLESGLEQAFRHYLYYFPERIIPKVYTCITGFNNSIIVGDSVLGIGLDRYLGSDCDYYPRLQIYKYISARMNSRNIIPDCMYAWGASEWDYEELTEAGKYAANNVMTRMIHEGKCRYFQKCMLPETGDTLIFGFSEDQMDFCTNNEAQMWLYLVEHDLLFSTDHFIIRKLTEDAPFTSYFTSESPGRAAVWIGFRIVESYMMKNPEIRLRELMEETDLQSILEKAKYNPR